MTEPMPEEDSPDSAFIRFETTDFIDFEPTTEKATISFPAVKALAYATAENFEAVDKVTSCCCYNIGGYKEEWSKDFKESKLTDEDVKYLKDNPRWTHLALILALGGLVAISKEITYINDEYIGRCWAAVCATNGVTDYIKMGIISRHEYINPLKEFHPWIRTQQQLRTGLINAVRIVDGTPLCLSIKEKILMIWRGSGLKSVALMESFIRQQNRALEVPLVAKEAYTLTINMAEVKKKTGPNYDFCKLYPPSGSDLLNRRNYPNLYYAALTKAIKDGKPRAPGRFKIPEMQGVDKISIDRLLNSRIRAHHAQDALRQTKFYHDRIGYKIPDNVSSSSSDEEDVPRRRRRK